MSDPQTDCEQLLGALIPFVEEMLAEHGEFFPVGAVMSPDGECELAAVSDDEEEAECEELIEMFESQFRAGADSGEYKATAIIFDALTIPPDKEEKQDTIICLLDHRDDYSVKVCFPYSVNEGELELEDPFAVEGEHKIFGAA